MNPFEEMKLLQEKCDRLQAELDDRRGFNGKGNGSGTVYCEAILKENSQAFFDAFGDTRMSKDNLKLVFEDGMLVDAQVL